MADDADVQAPEITLEDFMADEQEPAKTAPSTVETKTPEAKEEPKAEVKAAVPEVPVKDEAKPDEAKEETPPPEAEAKPDEKPLTKADERRQQLSTEIRDLVAQRNAIKSEVEKINSETYQPATETELTEQGMTEIEAKVEAMRQEREMEKFNTQVAEAQLTIGHESSRVLQDFDIFNPNSEQYDKELAEGAADFVASNLIHDPNTKQIIGSNVGIYKYYETLARASGISTAKGQIQGQKDTETMMANADTASSAAPPAKKVDPLTALWDEPL